MGSRVSYIFKVKSDSSSQWALADPPQWNSPVYDFHIGYPALYTIENIFNEMAVVEIKTKFTNLTNNKIGDYVLFNNKTNQIKLKIDIAFKRVIYKKVNNTEDFYRNGQCAVPPREYDHFLDTPVYKEAFKDKEGKIITS